MSLPMNLPMSRSQPPQLSRLKCRPYFCNLGEIFWGRSSGKVHQGKFDQLDCRLGIDSIDSIECCLALSDKLGRQFVPPKSTIEL